MIRYQLRCISGHAFEGWFPDSESFTKQASAGLISCPTCADTRVERALMAPAVHSGGRKRKEKAQPPAQQIRTPDQAIAVLQRMREYVEASCEDMGSDFADEALKMHRGESEKRGVYGTLTDEEREMLDGEGVETVSLPWVHKADS